MFQVLISKQIIDNLRETYSTNNLLRLVKEKNGEYAIGYLQGVNEVITYLEALSERGDAD